MHMTDSFWSLLQAQMAAEPLPLRAACLWLQSFACLPQECRTSQQLLDALSNASSGVAAELSLRLCPLRPLPHTRSTAGFG